MKFSDWMWKFASEKYEMVQQKNKQAENFDVGLLFFNFVFLLCGI